MAQASLLIHHGMFAAKGKDGSMTRDLFLSLALLVLLGIAIAITSGCFGGPSDIETRVRASEPLNLEP
jgi:hypothetical protein